LIPAAMRWSRDRLYASTERGEAKMKIVSFEHGEFCSMGAVTGNGLTYSFVAMNDTGTIEILHEKVGDDWMVVTGPAPLHLQVLVAAKCAEEAWKRGEGPDMPTLVIGAAT